MSPAQPIPEIVDQSFLFDTIHTLAPRREGLPDFDYLFDIPMGHIHNTNQGNQIKTHAETNFYNVHGELENTHTFIVRNLRCALIGESGLVDCTSPFYTDLHLNFSINRKTYWEGPAWRCADPLVTPAREPALTKEERDVLRRPIFPEGQYINGGECVRVRATYGRVWYHRTRREAPKKIMVFLEGALVRSIV